MRTFRRAETATPEETHRERVLTDEALRLASNRPVPVDLALRMRLAISHERVRAERRWAGRVQHHVQRWYDSTLRPMGVQVAVAAAAVVLIGAGAAMLGAVAPQQAVEANDAPLAGFSAPRYLYSVTEAAALTGSDEQPLVVQAEVNARGEVYTYRVVSGTLDAETAARLQERMLSSVFEPAKVFGEPVRGHVVLTFADVVVRG